MKNRLRFDTCLILSHLSLLLSETYEHPSMQNFFVFAALVWVCFGIAAKVAADREK